MKIGILTMNYRRNYGGILQCVALQHALREMGAEVVVLRFSYANAGGVGKALRLLLADGSPRTIWHIVFERLYNSLAMLLGRQKKLPKALLAKCARFVADHISYTELCDESTIGPLVERLGLDAVVIGSDKIWGAMADNQLVYFGEWTPRFQGRLLSYAACSSRPSVPKFNRQKLSALLSRFCAVSVRDEHTRQLVEPFCPKPIQVVQDPTVLYDFARFDAPRPMDEPYILAYILGREIEGGHQAVIDEIRRVHGPMPVVAIVLANESLDITPLARRVIWDASPQDWLTWFRHAAFVYTDSFHGIHFSMKFRRHFLAYYREADRATRLLDLKQRFALGAHIVNSVDEAMQKQTISQAPEYERIDALLAAERERSVEFLQNAIWGK